MFSKHERFQDTSSRKNVWTCEICGYKAFTKHRVQEHMDSHNKTKRHVCPTCGDAFVARYSLNYHVRKVHEGVQFDCDYCTYKTATVSMLNYHVRTKHTHVGVKPYKCYYCDYHSASSSCVNKHVQKKHPGMQYKWVKVGTFETLPPHSELKRKGQASKPLAIAPNPDYLRRSMQVAMTSVPSQSGLVAEIRPGAVADDVDEQFYLLTQIENGVPVVKLVSKQQLDLLNLKQEADAGGAADARDVIKPEVATDNIQADIATTDNDQFLLQYVTSSQAASAAVNTNDVVSLAQIEPTLPATSLQVTQPGALPGALPEQLLANVVQADLLQQAGLQLGDEQQYRDDESGKQDMQVVYVPTELMAGGAGAALVLQDAGAVNVMVNSQQLAAVQSTL